MEIGVFARGQRCNSIPLERIPLEAAQDLVDTGFARWVNNRHKNIIMTREPASLKLRDQSCKMGPRVTFAVWAGEGWAQELANAWA